MELYDVIIIGAGPAGLTAAIYAARYHLKTLVIGKVLGGEFSLAPKVENLPGFLSVSGLAWSEKTKEQVEKLGVKLELKEVKTITKESEKFVVDLMSGQEKYACKALIVATGSERRRLDIPGEKEYQGRGVSYCVVCDAAFFRDKTVAIIGGSDSAVSGAVHTAGFAKKVYIIYRKENLRAEPAWLGEWQELEKSGKAGTIYSTNLIEILGDGSKTTGVKFDKAYQGKNELIVDGVFIEIGGVPGTGLLVPLGVKMEETGHVLVDEKMQTNIPGLFCSGDVTQNAKIMQQAITAMAQGAISAGSAYKFLKGEKAPQILGTG